MGKILDSVIKFGVWLENISNKPKNTSSYSPTSYRPAPQGGMREFTVNINAKHPHYVTVYAQDEYDALCIAEKEWEWGVDKEYMKEYEDGTDADFYVE